MNIKNFFQIIGWEIINPFVLKLKKNKRYKFNLNFKGLNLGCGVNNPINWLGIDGGVYILFKSIPKFLTKIIWKSFNMSQVKSFDEYFGKLYKTKIIHHDLLCGIPLNDNTVPAIFSSHFLEHLGKNDAINLLKECFRVLKPSGILRICVPSLDKDLINLKDVIFDYENGNTDSIQKYFTSNLSGYVNKFSTHKHMYSALELKNILISIGFEKISERNFGYGHIIDVEILDTRDGLIVEAYKTDNPN